MGGSKLSAFYLSKMICQCGNTNYFNANGKQDYSECLLLSANLQQLRPPMSHKVKYNVRE